MVLGVVVQLFLVMMAVASAKEPLIAGRAAIRVLKHHKVAEPIFDAAFFSNERIVCHRNTGNWRHECEKWFRAWENPLLGTAMLQRLEALIRYLSVGSAPEILSTEKVQNTAQNRPSLD